MSTRLAYPPAHKVDQVDVYHGTAIADPYRWMEDLSDAALEPWIAEQDRLTADFLAGLPCRQAYLDRILELSRVATRGVPRRRGARWFQSRSTGDLSQPRLFVMSDPHDEGRLLLDPNTLGDHVVVTETVPSRDGSRLLYAESVAGSDWLTWQVLDVDSGEPMDSVGSAKLWARWLPDASGFFYISFAGVTATQRDQATNVPQLRLHRLGVAQDQDEVVFQDPERPQYFSPAVSDDGSRLIINLIMGTHGKVSEIRWAPLLGPWEFAGVAASDEQMWLLGTRGSTLYVSTTEGAPNGRVVAIDLADPAPESWRDVVPESGDPLPIYGAATLSGSRVVAVRDRCGLSVAEVWDLEDGDHYRIDLPPAATVGGLDQAESAEAVPDIHFAYTTPSTPGAVCSHSFDDRSTEVVFEAAVDVPAVMAEVVDAPSADGTMVPITLLRAPSAVAADPPVILEGYGGGASSRQPYAFSPWKLAWLERGGVIATAHLRGGMEKGRSWYEEGTRRGKVKVVEDFVGCAEHLVASGLTQPSRICITGRSNGGGMSSAAMLRRPDLFGACVPEVGLYDYLRYHLYGLGRLMIQEYGTSDDPDDFAAMIQFSPLQNVRPGVAYPATLVTYHHGDNRVAPGNSYKFTAALQEAQAGDAPVLLLTRADAGHFAGSADGEARERADILAFVSRALGAGC